MHFYLYFLAFRATGRDEMCNYYLMYYTKGSGLEQKSCFSLGPPFYYWTRSFLGNIPDKDASSLPVGETASEMGVKPHLMMGGFKGTTDEGQ